MSAQTFPWLIDGGDKSLPLPSHGDLKEFLAEHYLHSRFEGMAGPWCPDYADIVTRGSMDQLDRCGYALISPYESNRGRPIYFDRALRVLNPDAPPAQIQRRAAHLSHIVAGGAM
jgi:hypothetical protein